ncbi:MAG TPA: DNA internalization-related competence protein ComEC/Rec2 [Candidatus Polarisedimenticolia bacterium]|nr:DNA internalization-related competence protein ComEC/Rec2 [Candidatus Polarisedimenticolia bacterium]
MPPRQWAALFAAVSMLALLKHCRSRPMRLFILPLVLGGALGMAHRLADPLPALLSEWRRHGFEAGVTPIRIEGRVIDAETLPERRVAYLLRMRRYDIPGASFRRIRGSIHVRLTAPAPDDPRTRCPRPGDIVEVSGRLGTPRRFRNPGAFDYASYLEARGIDLVGTVKSARLIRVVAAGGVSFIAWPARARRHVVGILDRAADGGEQRTVSMLSALLVGERDDLPADFEDRLIRAGIYHIVALSGLNVALLVGLASTLLRRLPLTPRSRRTLLVVCVLIYWVVARPSGSIARAALMVLASLCGSLCERRVAGLGAMASASTLILAVRPVWSRDAGFQLSFAATLGILLLVRVGAGSEAPVGSGSRASRARRLVRRLCLWLLASLALSGAAMLSTSLVTALHFQTVAPIALVANIFAVPISALLLMVALAVCVLEPLAHSIAGSLIVVARLLIEALDRLAGGMAAPAWCSFFVLPPAAWVVVLGQSVVVLAGLGAPRLRRASLLLLALTMAGTVVRGHSAQASGRLEVVPLDVGQGDAILLVFPGGPTMLVDAGGFTRSEFDVGAKVVAPALRKLGHLKLDILAITHAHRDHLGGAMSILRSFSPRSVWLGRMPGEGAALTLERQAARQGIPVLFPRRGVTIMMGGVRVEVLNPGAGVPARGPAINDDSLVLRLTFGNRRVLLTGDLESGLERILTDEGRDVGADLLKVGHHGSRTSTSAAFLERVRPGLAVISVGSANPWGHPDAEVLRRLQAAGVALYRTDRDGAVAFTTDGRSPWRASRLTKRED